MVTSDAGNNWSIWDAEKQLPVDDYRKQHNLSPYIEDVRMNADGSGRMRLYKYLNTREHGPDLFTADYGLHWHLTK